MWNPFARKPAESEFPKPKWPPIQNLDSIDLAGQRRDGGVDLVIVASQPLDDAPETLDSIRQKVGAYLTALASAEFRAEMGNPPADKVAIVVACEHPVHPDALAVLGWCREAAAKTGVRLELRKSVTGTPVPLPEAGEAMEKSFRPPTTAEREWLVGQSAVVLAALRERFGDAQLTGSVGDLTWLQRLHDDGGLAADAGEMLKAAGIVFGEVLVGGTPLRWTSVIWQGRRELGLQYPGTTILVFPDSMIAKRVRRGERVDFVDLFASTAASVDSMKDDPEYRR